MRIENLATLARGELESNPSVSIFNGYAHEASKVQRGDLYIAHDCSVETIDEAIKNGAYGILYDENVEISDNEIAWIKVESLSVALIRLMRVQGAYKALHFIAVSKIQANIIKHMNLPNSLIVLPNNTKEAFNAIMKIEEGGYVFCSDELQLKKIAPNYEDIFTEQKTLLQKNGSIFVSSFIHDNDYYQKVPIAPIFVPALSGILSYLKSKNVSFDLNNFEPIQNNFEPIFVDSNIKPQPFGSTIRALIAESDEELFKFEAKSLLKLLPPNNLLICKHINSTSSMDVNFLYKDLKELKQLKNYNFKYALILCEKDELLDALSIENTKQYPSLFDDFD